MRKSLAEYIRPKAGIRLQLENFNFYADSITNTIKHNAIKVQEALGERLDEVDPIFRNALDELTLGSDTYSLNVPTINAWMMSFYVKL